MPFCLCSVTNAVSTVELELVQEQSVPWDKRTSHGATRDFYFVPTRVSFLFLFVFFSHGQMNLVLFLALMQQSNDLNSNPVQIRLHLEVSGDG